MFKYKYNVENINDNIILGSIDDIAKKTKQTPYDVFLNVYNLNTDATVNIKNFFGRYIARDILIFSSDKKKFLVYTFNAYFFRNKRAIRKFFLHYLSSLYILIPTILFEIELKIVFNFQQFLMATIFNILIFFSLFIHETAHFLTACYFNVECAFRINGLSYSVIYKTENNKKSLFISLMGPVSNLFIIFVLIILKIFIENGLLYMICNLSIIVNSIIAINILPCFKDGNNIMKELKIIINKMGGNV